MAPRRQGGQRPPDTPPISNGLAGPVYSAPHTDARAPFDLDRGRFAMSPRMAYSLLGAAAILGAGIAATHFRIGGIENTIGDMRTEMAEDRSATQTKQQAYIDCLEIERTNAGFRCPLAKTDPARTVVIPVRSKPRKAADKEQSSSIWAWPFPISPALAKGK